MADKTDTKATTAKADDVAKINEGEYAVKLTSDIKGGIGNHEKGKVLRNLSFSAFNTLVQGGLGTQVKPGARADGAVDASA